MFVGGELKNPNGDSIAVDGHVYYGSLHAGSANTWNFNAGSTHLATLSPENYPIDFGYYEWLALNIQQGTSYANGRKVFVVDMPRASGCYDMYDFLDGDAQGYDLGKTLIVFTYSDTLCLTETHDGRQWGPSVLAPFATVRLTEAGFSDGTIIAKRFSTVGGLGGSNWNSKGGELQLHGKMYDGPLDCV